MRPVVVGADLVEVDGLGDAWPLVEVTRVRPQVLVLDELSDRALEVNLVDGVESNERREQAPVGLDRSVAQPGYVSDVAPYLSAADIFVLPSLSECSGSVSVLEALRAGKPVIASACDGLPEDLLDGQDSLLVAPGDVGALAGPLV